MENLFKVWNQRNLTLKGRITIINSLIISLFVYPATILSIPDYVIQEIESKIYNFLWKRTKPKIAKATIEAPIELGGLKMPNFKLKTIAWQMNWLKRAALNPNLTYVQIINDMCKSINFVDLIRCRVNKHCYPIYENIPIFYQDILKEWYKERDYTEMDKLGEREILSEFLWCNKWITIEGKPFLWKAWYKSGIKFVCDIVNEGGDFLDANEINEKYGMKVSFLEILQLRKSLPFIWRTKLRNINSDIVHSPEIHVFMKSTATYKNLKSITTKELYWMLWKHQRKKKSPAAVLKWNQSCNLSDDDWENIFKMPFRSCTSTLLQCFQYKIIHRVIACRKWLYNLRVLNSSKCLYCDDEDSIGHFFYNCVVLKQFWISFKNWWSKLTNRICYEHAFNEQVVVFGVKIDGNESITFNYCLIVAKYFIYINRLQESQTFDFYRYQCVLKCRLEEEYTYYKENGKLDSFYQSKGLIHKNL